MTRYPAQPFDFEHSGRRDAPPLGDGLWGDPKGSPQLGSAAGKPDSKVGQCLAHESENKPNLHSYASDTFMTAPKASLTMLGMQTELGSRIRAARKAQKLTMEQVAKELGVSYPAVQQWETGKTVPTTENLIRLQSILGYDLLAVTPDGKAVAVEVKGYTKYDEPNAEWEQGPIALPKLIPGANDIEEKGITVGGFGDDESAFELNGETIDYVRRPPGIIGRKNVFALRVSNTSMEPKYDDGERVYAEKRHPAVRDFVVVELLPLGDGRPSKSYIKRLVAMDATKITVEQYNPRGQLEFGRHEVKNLYRVIPEKELRGEV